MLLKKCKVYLHLPTWETGFRLTSELIKHLLTFSLTFARTRAPWRSLILNFDFDRFVNAKEFYTRWNTGWVFFQKSGFLPTLLIWNLRFFRKIFNANQWLFDQSFEIRILSHFLSLIAILLLKDINKWNCVGFRGVNLWRCVPNFHIVFKRKKNNYAWGGGHDF